VRTTPWPKYPVLGADEEAAAVRVVRAQNLCEAFGTEVREFEREFAAYLGVMHAIAVCNGTAALHTALAAAGVGVGHEVIVPPYTFVATATAVPMQNAIPVFADIEPRTQGLDPAEVAKRITARTRAVIPVHMNGFPMEIEAIMDIAKRHNLIVIEDCSHAHGAAVGDHKAGTFGHINAFSFQQKKNLSLGEGGAVVTDDPTLAERARAFRSFGKVPLPVNYRMPELHGAIGRVRLRKLDEQNAERIRNAQCLDEALAGLRGIRTQRPRPGTTSVYYNYIVQVYEEELGIDKATFLKALQAEGIPATPGYYPLQRHHTFQIQDAHGRGCPFRCPLYDPPPNERPRYVADDCPVTVELCDRRNIELKIHPPAGLDDMKDIATAIRKIVAHVDELRA